MTLAALYDLSDKHPIMFYDGVCNLCNGFVQWMLQRDHHGRFRFAALQDPTGVTIRKELNMGQDISTVIGVYQRKIYTHSEVLKLIATILGGWWRLALPLYLLPARMRDRIYNWAAHNRYRWFGKKESCIVPSADIIERFIR